MDILTHTDMYLPTPALKQGVTQGQFLNGVYEKYVFIHLRTHIHI